MESSSLFIVLKEGQFFEEKGILDIITMYLYPGCLLRAGCNAILQGEELNAEGWCWQHEYERQAGTEDEG
jgi:hypothetical protein